MKIIGITGGVGAGKSRILSILQEEYQAEIIVADEVAKELEAPGMEGYRLLIEAFGDGILGADGAIDRSCLASLIFQDEKALQKVNAIIHPITWSEIKRRAGVSKAPLIVVESALFDEHSRELCEELWFVDTSEENRIERLMKNRGYSRQKCLDIMANQSSRAFFLQLSDIVIDNNGCLDEVRSQIAEVLGTPAQRKATKQ